MDITERFLNYTKFDTQSSEESESVPSTAKQLVFAEYLKKELEDEGLSDVEMDDKGYIYATLKSNIKDKVPTIGFIAHYDTSPDCSGENVQAQIINNYTGCDILLSAEDSIVLSPKKFPELLQHVGEDLIVTDGHTLLGADDKAGIAEIVSAIAYLQEHPEIKHGKIRIAFNPDEEIGLGAHKFDVEHFAADWAYTMDGGEVGELEYENFNAASARITIKGRNVHPGTAKNKMINSTYLASKFMAMLPHEETPENTEKYEGFYHLIGIEGSVEQTTLTYIIRDHDRQKFEERKANIERLVAALNEEYPGSTTAELKDQYYNMREKIEPVMHVIDIAQEAMRRAEVTPKVQPIRGGTDGAQLSFKGLPCPNIFAGGVNFHGRYEFVAVPSMQKAQDVIVEIVRIVGERY